MNKATQAALALVVLGGLALFQSISDETPSPTSVASSDVAAPANSGSAAPTALALAVPSGDDAFTGRVVRVSDGDTIVVEVVDVGSNVNLDPGDEVKVRMLRIDTPELEREDQPLECWATEATEALRTLAPTGSLVTLQHDVERVDRFGRDLAHVWGPDGTWLNGRMLLDGHARVVTFRPNVAHEDRVRNLEAVAQDARAGRWGACSG